MPPPKNVILGTFTRAIVDGAVWREKHPFPAHQEWADEIEYRTFFVPGSGKPLPSPVYGAFLNGNFAPKQHGG